MNGIAKRILRRALEEEKQRILDELYDDPIRCMQKLLDDCGISFENDGNKIRVITNKEEYIVLAITKESRQ
jgi:hypothetical protein